MRAEIYRILQPMHADLPSLARRHADAHGPDATVIVTPVPGLVLLREHAPTELLYAVSKPLVALVLQGRKHVAMGARSFDFGAGESLLITADVPTVSQITEAAPHAPYLSIVVELDVAIIEGLVVEIGAAPYAAGEAVQVSRTEDEVRDAVARLLRLVERPASVPVLQPQLLRELHYWLLAGRHGGAIRALGVADSHAQRIGRAIGLIRAEYAQPLGIERLAARAGMSVSGFHAHFRALTASTPLQFQKQLRLIEARRIMLAEGRTVADAAVTVGYESVPQFTREYARMFGIAPGRDVRGARARKAAA